MIGQTHFYSLHQGDVFEENGQSFACLNGQTLSRSSYPAFSDLWPSGFYGSTDTICVLPDFNNSYLRGLDLGAGNDFQENSRYSPSGVFPSGAALGSFQDGSMQFHEHASGSQLKKFDNANTDNPCTNLSIKTSTAIALSSSCSRFTVLGTTDETEWEPANYKAYPYIRIL
jgi:hypothetical protein